MPERRCAEPRFPDGAGTGARSAQRDARRRLGEAGIQALASDRCSPLDYGGPGEPDFVIAGDLPLERGSLSFSRPMADALELALERRNYQAGRFHVGLQVCDDATPTETVFSQAVCAENAAAFARTPSVIGVVEAMDVLLAAIARSDGTRPSVTRNLLTTRISNRILGSFWITSMGDTTLNAVTIFRVVHGKVTTYDTITVPEDLLAGT